MDKRFCFALGCTGLILVLTACGYTPDQHPSQNASTPSKGAVRISTDHTTYRKNSQIHVTVHNTLSTPVYALDSQAGCSILSFETYVDGTWRSADVARCPGGHPTSQVKVDAGKVYSATIQAIRLEEAFYAIPAGTYRLVLKYATTISESGFLHNPLAAYSETFTVTGGPPPIVGPASTL